jgi:tRNA U34 5-methylaminomethyl-2-thiouridine-forming methyltransferase MnmC
MKREIKITGDGSTTIFLPQLGEHFHSIHGAVVESEHVFIEQGLRQTEGINIMVFEMGLGTGLNALLSWLVAEKKQCRLVYHGIEQYPLPDSIIDKLNYPAILGADSSDKLRMIHSAPWDQEACLSPVFTLVKIHGNLLEFVPSTRYHIIYFDAFSPDKQPELWEVGVFHKMFNMMLPGGILVTYSAKGEVKRRLKTAGFIVQVLPGPPGKREMIRAVKSNS